jgi:ankyrin repeat protein
MTRKPLFISVLVFSLLLFSGCRPNPASLIAAVKADNTEDARKLIEKGADANSRESPGGWSVLHYAARNGNAEIVQALLNAGANPNYSGTMERQTGSAVSLRPLLLAQATLDLVNQLQPSETEANLRKYGLDDPTLLKRMKEPKAAERYRKVVELLAKVTK